MRIHGVVRVYTHCLNVLQLEQSGLWRMDLAIDIEDVGVVVLDLSCICLHGLEYRRCIHIGGFSMSFIAMRCTFWSSKPDFCDLQSLTTTSGVPRAQWRGYPLAAAPHACQTRR